MPDTLEDEKALERYKGTLAKIQARFTDRLTRRLDVFEDDVAKKLERFKDARVAEGDYLKNLSVLASTAWENARDGAKHVVTAASAIATLYAGVVGVVFAVKDNPLPQRGIWAILFLGLAVVLAAAYLAPIFNTDDTVTLDNTLPDEAKLQQLVKLPANMMALATALIVTNQRYVRAALVSLGVGAAFTLAPFIGNPPPSKAAAPSPPPVPATQLTDEARQAYKWQVELYRQALCQNDETKAVVADCNIDTSLTSQTLVRESAAGVNLAEAVTSPPSSHDGWNANTWSFLAAIGGFLLVASTCLLGRKRPVGRDEMDLQGVHIDESPVTKQPTAAEDAITTLLVPGHRRPPGWETKVGSGRGKIRRIRKSHDRTIAAKDALINTRNQEIHDLQAKLKIRDAARDPEAGG